MPFRGRCKYNPCGQPEPLTDMSFRASKASRGIFPSCRFYLVMVLSPTRWIPPLRFAPVGMTEGTTSPRVSFRASEASRGIFPSGKLYLVLVLCPTWWIPPLRLRCGRNDKRYNVSTDSPTVSATFHAAPREPHQSRPRASQLPHGGSFCTVSDGNLFILT